MKMKTYPLLKKADFPDGVQCVECLNHIAPNQPYDEVTVSVVEDTLTVEIVCVYH